MDPTGSLLFVTQVAPYSPSAPYHTALGLAGAHGVLPQAWMAFRQIADVVGLSAQLVEDVRELDDDAVGQARAVVLFTIGETPWSPAQRAELVDGVGTGRLALVVVHSGLDACLEWPEYGRLAGARFDGHPYTGAFEADVVVADHPATAHLGATWSVVDELYTFRDLRPDARGARAGVAGRGGPERDRRRRADDGIPDQLVRDRGRAAGCSRPPSATSRRRGSPTPSWPMSPAA